MNALEVDVPARCHLTPCQSFVASILSSFLNDPKRRPLRTHRDQASRANQPAPTAGGLSILPLQLWYKEHFWRNRQTVARRTLAAEG